MNRGDVYDARLSPTEGSEQAGTRPVVVMSRNAINRYSSVIVVVPMTNAINVKRSYPNNIEIPAGIAGLTANSVALTGQVRAISKTRLLRLRGSLPSDLIKEIEAALRITFDL